MAGHHLARMQIPGGMPIRRVMAAIAAMAIAAGIDGQLPFISRTSRLRLARLAACDDHDPSVLNLKFALLLDQARSELQIQKAH
jgi:hypothetical protein